LYEFDWGRWDCGFYVLDRSEGFLFASGCEVDTFWVALRELEDALLSEADVAFQRAVSCNLTAWGDLERRHTASDEDHLSIEGRDVFLCVERYPAWEDSVQHCSFARGLYKLAGFVFDE